MVLVIAAGCVPPLPTLGADVCPDIASPVLELTPSPIKQLALGWAPVPGAEHHRLLESAAPGEPFVPLAEDVAGTSLSLTIPLHLRAEASYVVSACDATGCCTDSSPVGVTGSLAEAVGYLKASNTDENDEFGSSVALSVDGSTLVVGAPGEAAGDTSGNENDSSRSAGAVYVFVRDPSGHWSQQASLEAFDAAPGDRFGSSVALGADGNTLIVGAPAERSSATGIDGNEADDAAPEAGAVYVLGRDLSGHWSQQAYVKASNTHAGDRFGESVALSADGSTIAVGAPGEDSLAKGIDADSVGAVYVFELEAGQWSQQAYVKASNADSSDSFGRSVALSDDGGVLVVGAPGEASGATGIDGDQDDETASAAGAVYVFVRSAMHEWTQEAYVKASNTDANDRFGSALALSGDGNTLAVGAYEEASGASGIDGDQDDDSVEEAGAVYVLGRDPSHPWSQRAYVKASNPQTEDGFGESLALSGDGRILAVAARREDGGASGIGGEQTAESVDSGAVYVLVLDASGRWKQQAYVKSSNPGRDDGFGVAVALTADGSTLAVGASREDSSATGIGSDQADDSAIDAGAAYLY